MLILDQHSSRFNLQFIEFCRENYIKLFLLAPNLTHLISVGVYVSCHISVVQFLALSARVASGPCSTQKIASTDQQVHRKEASTAARRDPARCSVADGRGLC